VSAPFSPPHSNGSDRADDSPDAARDRHTSWELRLLMMLVAIMAIGIVLAWVFIGSKSPERLDATATAQLSAACTDAQAQLEALGNPSPTEGADRVARVRAENAVLRAMVGRFDAVQPNASTPAAALRAWSEDWTRVIDARERYATTLEGTRGTNEKVQFVLPKSTGLKPVTKNMDDFVRENHPNMQPCFTERLELERVEGARRYPDVTE
jgi:hypothetical protein